MMNEYDRAVIEAAKILDEWHCSGCIHHEKCVADPINHACIKRGDTFGRYLRDNHLAVHALREAGEQGEPWKHSEACNREFQEAIKRVTEAMAGEASIDRADLAMMAKAAIAMSKDAEWFKARAESAEAVVRKYAKGLIDRTESAKHSAKRTGEEYWEGLRDAHKDDLAILRAIARRHGLEVG
jgi:hypothetical protein